MDFPPEILSVLVRCAGCGTLLCPGEDYSGRDTGGLPTLQDHKEVWKKVKDAQSKEVRGMVRDLRDSVVIGVASLSKRGLHVCANRRETRSNGPLEKCRMAALQKASLCPCCGEETRNWPLACDLCSKRVDKAASLSEHNDGKRRYRVVGWTGFKEPEYGDPTLNQILSSLFTSFGVGNEAPGEVEEISFQASPSGGYREASYETRMAPVAALTDDQASATKALLRHFVLGSAKAVASAYREGVSKGSSFLGMIAAGKTTFDALEDEAEKRARLLQSDADRIEAMEKKS